MTVDIYCCRYCRFMRHNECHINPPVVTDAEYGRWPKVHPGDWCGCYDFSKEAEQLQENARIA